MSSIHRWVALAAGLLVVAACGEETDGDRVSVPGREGAFKSSATTRAARRAYDGAPPVIPHPPLGAACISCHNERGLFVPDLGYAPDNPHRDTPGLSSQSRCQQCHVFSESDELFVPTSFVGRAQDLVGGERQHELAPPVIPHPVFMRENCHACHTGPAAREEMRTTHPERENCRQCHVPANTDEAFSRH